MATTTRRTTARRRPAPRGPEAVVKEFRRTLHRIARALPIDDLDRRLTDVEKMVGRLDKEVRKTLRKRFGTARRPVHHEPVRATARRPAKTAARRRRPAARPVARHRAA